MLSSDQVPAKEGMAVAPMLAFQSAYINSTELNTPEADRLAADCDSAVSTPIRDLIWQYPD